MRRTFVRIMSCRWSKQTLSSSFTIDVFVVFAIFAGAVVVVVVILVETAAGEILAVGIVGNVVTAVVAIPGVVAATPNG